VTLAPDYVALAQAAPEGTIDLTSLVSGAGLVEVEVGIGRGLFLLERARAFPAVRLLGLERKAKLAYLVEQRRVALGLRNAKVLRADALELLGRAGPDACLARVFIHFPDPWWKKKHAKRRVVSDALLDSVVRLLGPGGELFIQTDVEERAEDTLALLRARPELEAGLVSASPYGAMSNRERRAVTDGLPIWRILATRARDALPRPRDPSEGHQRGEERHGPDRHE